MGGVSVGYAHAQATWSVLLLGGSLVIQGDVLAGYFANTHQMLLHLVSKAALNQNFLTQY